MSVWRYFRRRKLPKELQDALQAAKRHEQASHRRAAYTRKLNHAARLFRRVPMFVWFVVLAVPIIAAGVVASGIDGAALWPSAPSSAPPGRLSGLVRVVDGDTLAMGSDRLRIHGIDAPEISQTCDRGGEVYRCGEAARDALVRAVGRGMVSCDVLDRDRYGRKVVRCHGEGGQDIGAAMVSAGWAVAFTRYSYSYVPQELSARFHRRGLWAGSFETPSDYRRRSGQP